MTRVERYAGPPRPGRSRAAARHARRVAVAVWRRGREVELMHRALAFAALCFVTLVPLLVVIAAASPARGGGIADWIADGLGLSGRSSTDVAQLFASRREVLGTTTALGLAALAVFGVTLMTAVQNAYERIWQLAPGAWHGVWRQVAALGGLIGYLLAATWSRIPWQHTSAQPALRAAATAVGGVLLFWWLPRLLLGARVPWRRLLPGAVATVLALAGLRAFSRLVFAPLIVSNVVAYGPVGTVLVVQSWLIGAGFCVYGGAIVGRALLSLRVVPHRRGPR
ncbi:YihY/virulence factor BrkB family protein [Kitasatospora sp. NBC_01560]|uniref:YhjD/YihY/BrkB family envelope integrity protein n=1 Tax=Kitasatospora sp. NBC_01560 TaxID=2975965 RepID=UPI003870CB8B